MMGNKLHYFQSCGLCNHKGSACRTSTRKPGHKSEATVTNRLGVATAVPTALSSLGLKIKLQGGTGDTYENKDNLINFIDQAYPYPPISNPNKPRTDPATTLISETGKTGNFAAVNSNICTNVKPVT